MVTDFGLSRNLPNSKRKIGDYIPFSIEKDMSVHFMNIQKKMIPIVIGNYGKAELTAHCIDSIKENTDAHHSIVLVENGTERRKKPPGVNYLHYEKPLGFTRAYNEGIRFARKNLIDWKYICLMNNDVRVEFGWLEPLIKTMETQEKVAIVSPILDCPNNKNDYDIPAHADLLGGHIFGLPRDKYKKETVESYHSINFTCVLINREFLDDYGLLDESMVTFCSDQDLALRASYAGWKCLICHESIVNHEVNATVNDETLIPAKEKSETLRKDQKQFLDKWSGLWLNEIMAEIPLNKKIHYDAAVSFFIRYPDGAIINWKTGELMTNPRKILDTVNLTEKFARIKGRG